MLQAIFAEYGGTPAHNSTGKAIKVPPAATALIAPALKPAAITARICASPEFIDWFYSAGSALGSLSGAERV
ncbi:unannotated protein [freshwater metagenome]|uniref:Unannotated protein n=1 Tax=freshwater metagenome TaxID=449393 RepID=A0A6J6W9H8_9ZZZZ